MQKTVMAIATSVVYGIISQCIRYKTFFYTLMRYVHWLKAEHIYDRYTDTRRVYSLRNVLIVPHILAIDVCGKFINVELHLCLPSCRHHSLHLRIYHGKRGDTEQEARTWEREGGREREGARGRGWTREQDRGWYIYIERGGARERESERARKRTIYIYREREG